jgi:hypothetical protein
MPLPADLFWTHPTGDSSTVPCTHFVKQHENDGVVTVPCTHPPVRQHAYDTVLGQRVACRHWVPAHPGGDRKTVECVHNVPQHPGGDPGPDVPCAHPLQPVSHDFSGNLIFYTNNSEIREAAVRAVNRIQALSGVNVLNPRPLHIFNRGPVYGDPFRGDDPFKTSYHRGSHAIQIMRGALSGDALAQAVYHEMGHAALGHRCVKILSPGGSHDFCAPSTPEKAMSEGWANFVAMAIMGAPQYGGMDWESRMACGLVPPRTDIEYFVGCCLWDLYDAGGEDAAQISFRELFRVYSPTLQTLTDGPVLNGIDDYLQRLKQNNPAKADQIEKVRIANFVMPQQPNWRWCKKCQGLIFFGRNESSGKCPAGAGHTREGSFEYFLVHSFSLPDGQDNWRWCRKCEGLFFAGNPSLGACPGGGVHDPSGSWNYSLLMNAPSSAPGQRNWRWCNKCQGLFFGGNPSQGVCQAGGAHSSSGSGDYAVRHSS